MLLLAVACTPATDRRDRRGTPSPATTTAPPPTPSPTVEPTPTPSPTPTAVPPPPTLERGASNEDVARLQARLEELRYWVGPVDGVFGTLTLQAVWAFQKAEGLERNGVVSPEVWARLAAASPPKGQSTSGSLIEIDKPRQLLFVIRDGAVLWAFNTSTGTDERYRHPDGGYRMADTPSGEWTISWQVDGWRDGRLGPMWRPKYFHEDGIAIHGYDRVPPEPVSHGCARISMDGMNLVWEQDLAPVGSVVWVY